MAVDISDKVQSLRVISSVEDMEAGGTVVLAGTDLVDDGTLDYDKQIYVSVGYEDDNNLILRGVITDIEVRDTVRGDKETELTLMSPFKNYRKTILHTKYFPDDTPIKSVLELLAGTYMGLPPEAYDFDRALTELQKFRIEDMIIPEAMQKLAEICALELAWYQGKLMNFGQIEATIEYDKSRCSSIERGQKPDTDIITAVNVIGRGMDREGGERKQIGEQVISKDYLMAETNVEYFETKLDELPADDLIITHNATKFSFFYVRMRNNYAVIMAIRTSAGNEPNDVTVKIEGRVYKDRRIERKVVRAVPIPGYHTEAILRYDNPFADWDSAGSVGSYILLRKKYSLNPITVIAPHNSDLIPNTNLVIKKDEEILYEIIVRTIETTWRASDFALEDKITGWEW